MKPLTLIGTQILQDFRNSETKDLGEFALNHMKVYDDLAYELTIEQAESDRGKVYGHATAPTRQILEDLVAMNNITGTYHIKEIDCQHEFFCVMAEIRDYLKQP